MSWLLASPRHQYSGDWLYMMSESVSSINNFNYSSLRIIQICLEMCIRFLCHKINAMCATTRAHCLDQVTWKLWYHGPLARYVKLRVAHAPGMPGTFSPPPRVSDPDMHLGTCATHVPWCMPGSLTNGFHWSRWRGKRFRHLRRMRNPQCYVCGKMPMAVYPLRRRRNY